MTCQQREEYIAPVCETLVFEVEDAITQTQSGAATPVYSIGGNAVQEDDELE